MNETNPLLESDILTCPHKGIVQLKSLCGNLLEVEGVGVITESDLLHSPIIGCTNNIAGIPTPCTQVSTIPPNAISLILEVNGSGVILQSQIPTILTDKGFPLTLQNKTSHNIVYLKEEDKAREGEVKQSENARLNTQSTMESHHNTNSHKDSTKETEKQITEIYFSYGEDKIKFKDISRHSQDINLHIKTQGYSEGEEVDLTLEFQEKTFQISATIRDNQATILNVLNEIEGS
ncbi:hypothetical protein [uncultured Helicobacter sp.]|uniref:hypothetical protein n=1 Tax=uncultured Helicobacter sp. TaxID=175537 RepID=UPI00262E6F30|nr:hypothetical protein [uncultured Helicobacter sp.]